MTIAPAFSDYVPMHGKSAEFVLTASQWHPAMQTADGFFGTSAEYSAGYQQLIGQPAEYVAAGASATAYTLALAISSAFALCDISGAQLDADRLLYDPTAVVCKDSVGRLLTNRTGYQAILDSLTSFSVRAGAGRVARTHARTCALYACVHAAVRALPLTPQSPSASGAVCRLLGAI